MVSNQTAPVCMKISRLVFAITAVLLLLVSPLAQAQSCQDFAAGQIRLSDKQLERNNFSALSR